MPHEFYGKFLTFRLISFFFSGERVLRSRQHERGTSQERRYKRSHRRSPSSGRQHSHVHSHRERDRDRDRDRQHVTHATSSRRARPHRHHGTASPSQERHRHRSPPAKSQVSFKFPKILLFFFFFLKKKKIWRSFVSIYIFFCLFIFLCKYLQVDASKFFLKRKTVFYIQHLCLLQFHFLFIYQIDTIEMSCNCFSKRKTHLNLFWKFFVCPHFFTLEFCAMCK